ncbi:type II toxin-antitoxin system VapC family toxin [bacterium]|nr:type II toxin-antitoxin system VapC family toxin [bacterium]
MIVMDSSGWVEIVAGGPRQHSFMDTISGEDGVFVPTLVLYEVYRYVERERGEDEADRIAAHLRSHTVVELSDEIALAAARLGKRHHLATADAVIYATAHHLGATLVTGDRHFAEVADVMYIPVESDAQPPR